MQPIKCLNTLDDHNDKHLEDKDVALDSKPSPAHWPKFHLFVGLIPWVQYQYEGISIIVHRIWRRTIGGKIKDGIRGPPILRRLINIPTFCLYVEV